MHEQAQIAKLRRAVVTKLARFGGARLLGLLPLSPAESAALALRKHAKQTAINPTTTFAIPLVGAHQVSDWSVIEETLSLALKALIAQSDPNWRAVICSQTRPKAIDLDPRISHLPFDTPVEGHDKVAKLNALTQHCLVDDPKAGFFMPLDGDDLLHRDLIKDLNTAPSNGLLVCSGLILNAGTGRIGLTQNRSLAALGQKPFWKFCGSCMVLPVGSAPEAEARFFTALSEHEHRLYPYLAELAGYTLEDTTEPRALYIINHGENFETRRGRGGFKQRFVERFAITDEDQLAAIRSGFVGAETLLKPSRGDS
ncbi:glycosyltransferase family A protein [Planktotalea sp.]|uniref:glycosyltransferase family A protein n=1 Tax=Planktotalea sp. TaxID=2029877 RepID=UPI003297FD66